MHILFGERQYLERMVIAASDQHVCLGSMSYTRHIRENGQHPSDDKKLCIRIDSD